MASSSTVWNPWHSDPELSREDNLKHRGIQSYNYPPRAEHLNDTHSILPRFDHITKTYTPSPIADAIIVALDFEDLCMEKVGKHSNGEEYRYKPITEVGIVWLDTRPIVADNVDPQDRGIGLWTKMKPAHWISEEWQHHWGHDCKTPWHNTAPYAYAFGKSEKIPEARIAARLKLRMQQVNKINRTPQERKANTLRTVIVLAWDTQLEEKTISRLGVEEFHARNVHIFDLQHLPVFSDRLNCPLPWSKASVIMETLGLRFIDGRFGDISHCAGNGAVFIMQILLAVHYMNQGHREVYRRWGHLSWLRFSWSGQHMDRQNLPPDQQGEARDLLMSNDGSQDQVSSVEEYYFAE